MEDESFGESEGYDSGTTKLHESVESSIFQIPFPLPPQTDPSLCRDQFLSTILKEYDKYGRVTKPSVVLHLPHLPESKGVTAEAMAIQQMITEKLNKPPIRSLDLSRSTLFMSLEQQLEIVRAYIREFQKAAVDFLTVRLFKQLKIFESVWPGDINEIPHKLFNWSVDCFLNRLTINQLYLDVISLERSPDYLDCLKYRTDLIEISRILNAIREDYSLDRELCSGAISVINAANYDKNSKWINEIEEISRIHGKLVKKIEDFRSSSLVKMQTSDRQTALLLEDDTQDAITPIELRYRIKWVRAGVEQCMMRIQQKDLALEDELKNIVNKMSQDALSFHYTDVIYSFLIHKYRNELNEWQQRYDNDFENADLLCTQTRLAVEKLKDEYKFYCDQLAMMKQRIAEVTEIIKKEQEEREIEEKARLAKELDRKSNAGKRKKKDDGKQQKKKKRKSGKK